MSSTTFLPLAGKVALITGGNKGIGRATAIRLAHDGAKVAINYASSSEAADEVVKALGPDNCVAIKADASDVKSIDRLVAETVKKFGKIDILIPNAGIMPPMKDLSTITEEMYDNTFALNVKGPLFLAQKAVPHMAPGSHIIFVSTSLLGTSTMTPNYMLYMASKGAVEQLVRVMSKELFRKGIAVNAVAPGPTGTELFYQGKSDALVKTISGFSPAGRIGTPEEIAAAFAYLSSSDSSWVSGQTLRVNGGMA